jgi:toxin ParE1/3/4
VLRIRIRIRIRPRARADLIEIWDYIAEDSVANADAFVDNIHETMQMLANQPRSGRRRAELAPDILSFPFGRYIIFYRSSRKGLEIVRILHGSRDIEAIFEA